MRPGRESSQCQLLFPSQVHPPSCSGRHIHLSSPQHWAKEQACEIVRSFWKYSVKDLFAYVVPWCTSSFVCKVQLGGFETLLTPLYRWEKGVEVIAAYTSVYNPHVIAYSRIRSRKRKPEN